MWKLTGENVLALFPAARANRHVVEARPLPRGLQSRSRPPRRPENLEELVFAAEDRANRVVCEHVHDRLGEQRRDGKHRHPLGTRDRVDRHGVRDHDAADVGRGEALESVAAEEPVCGEHPDLLDPVRLQGLDFRQGEVLLNKGQRLSDRDVMLAAAMNYAALPVHRRPKVAVLATGDELVPPGTTPKLGEIVYSNGFAVLALAREAGAEIRDLGIARDKVDEIAAAVRRGRDWKADVLVTMGGASVGEHDLVQQALKDEGLDLSFWRVALRPGRPMMHGRLGPMHVLGVPGNPVSAYVCAFLFLLPLIGRLTGRAEAVYAPQEARLGRELPANDERQDYLRATLAPGPDGPVATPLPDQDSSLMAPLAKADCLLIREPHAPAASSGSRCVILKLGL